MNIHCTYFDIPTECSNDFLCNEEEVLDLLLSLDVNKANGPAGISASMLKHTGHSIAQGLTLLFNMSLRGANLPKEWKLSAINPIPKGSAKSNTSNYRPISLLCIISKLLERHMHKLLLGHLE